MIRNAFGICASVVLLALINGCGSLIVTSRSVESLRETPGFSWTEARTDGFIIYADRGGVSADSVDRIAQQVVISKSQVLLYMSLQEYPPTVAVFAVDTRQRMQDLIGRRTNATGFFDSNVLCLVWPRSGGDGLTHELTHVVAMNVWGVPQRWINEGVAVDATGDWIGRDLHNISESLRKQGELPTLRKLIRQFDSVPSARSYPAVGSFVRFVRETYGIDAVRQIWDGGYRAIPEATGFSEMQVETQWLAMLHESDSDGLKYDSQSVTPIDDR